MHTFAIISTSTILVSLSDKIRVFLAKRVVKTDVKRVYYRTKI